MSGIGTISADIPVAESHARIIDDLSSGDHGFCIDSGLLEEPNPIIRPISDAFSDLQLSADSISDAWPRWNGWNRPITTTPGAGAFSGGGGEMGRSVNLAPPQLRNSSPSQMPFSWFQEIPSD